MAVLSLRVYTKHKDAMDERAKQPINTPIAIDPANLGCQSQPGSLARLEPAQGVLVGYSPNWNPDVPTTVNQRLGKRAAVFNTFMRLVNDPVNPVDQNMLDWHAQEVINAGGIMALTLEPIDMKGVTDAIIDKVTDHFRRLNAGGCPIILRYGHEMNGEWTNYGYRPNTFIPGFQKMATAVRAKTNLTAMLWSPNVGAMYPFTATAGDGSTWQTADAANLALLDTNGNGIVDAGDDPYLPYYPGDEFVDWVGLSLYYYQDTAPNAVPQATFFDDYLEGRNLVAYGADASVNLALRNFYQRFAVEKNKPMALSESGAGYLMNQAGATELAVKQGWWEQTLNTATLARLPQLKLIINFEEQKNEAAYVKNWAVTTKPDVLAAYNAHLSQVDSSLLWANKLGVSCDGSLKTNA
ncbi:mannan endo-1,4-beta-mannosidase [Spizellomyces sp. 'palustris']|nr:mannan endo-1,4-beta-mannosidase [Spizellomyces sp. 'palustris']